MLRTILIISVFFLPIFDQIEAFQNAIDRSEGIFLDRVAQRLGYTCSDV